jgi:hypothetical protein
MSGGCARVKSWSEASPAWTAMSDDHVSRGHPEAARVDHPRARPHAGRKRPLTTIANLLGEIDEGHKAPDCTHLILFYLI